MRLGRKTVIEDVPVVPACPSILYVVAIAARVGLSHPAHLLLHILH